MNEVLQRLTVIIERHYNGSRPDFARALGKSSQTLNGYFQKDSKPGSDFLTEIFRLGFSSDWLLTGEGTMYADNEAGRALTASHAAGGVLPKRFVLPAWAVSITTTPTERLAKAIELLGGIEQAATILSTPADEVLEATLNEAASFPVMRDCAKLGFSMNWLHLARGMYYDSTEEGTALRKAVETNTTAEWASALYRAALLNSDTTPKAPRTIAARMALSRLWLCEYHNIPFTAKAFADFLNKSQHNTSGHVFTPQEVEGWEAGSMAANDAMPIVGEEGVNVFWIMTGMEKYSLFDGSETGQRLQAWYSARSENESTKSEKTKMATA